MVEVSLTVGKLDASLALLLTKDHHLIEFPTILLPNGVKAGSIVKIKCDRDLATEKKEAEEFQQIQDEILNTFGKNLPQPPVLSIKNVTQTSCVLEWDTLDLGTASLKNLVLFKDDKKLGAIPQPLTNRTTKLSGLPIDKAFLFQLRLDTTAGVYLSNLVEVKTHKMTDLSGITVCLGDITANDQFTVEDIQETLKNMGANYPAQDKLMVDTTHFITTRENKQNPEYLKANEMNIPIVRPEWLKACELERRIVGVRDFYVKDCVLPDILAKNYWGKGTTRPQVPAKDVAEKAGNEPEPDSQVIDSPETDKAPESSVPVTELKPITESESVTEPEPVSEITEVDSLDKTASEEHHSLGVAGEEIRIETFDLVPLEDQAEVERNSQSTIIGSAPEAVEEFAQENLDEPAEAAPTAEEDFNLAEHVKEVNEVTDSTVEAAVSGEPVETLDAAELVEPADTIEPAESTEIDADTPVEYQPEETVEESVETAENPVESAEDPVETSEDPVETAEDPVDTTEKSVKESMEQPTEESAEATIEKEADGEN